jgi:GDPmannose 4,6-dehydratase
MEKYTFCVNTLGTLHILQGVRKNGLEKKCKIYNAGTSEQFGNTLSIAAADKDPLALLNEDSLMKPVSIYGISKKAAQEICDMYRDSYGMFIVSSLLFNHESSRRGQTFVTQKIARYVAKYYKHYSQQKPPECVKLPDFSEPLCLGNLNARRDWGAAEEYVRAIYIMLLQDVPKNYVIATGQAHTVREFVETAFRVIDVDVEWIGESLDEIGIDKTNKRILVKVDQKYYRDIDIDCLIGDSSRATRELGWHHHTGFVELVKNMVTSAIIES